MLSDQIWDGHKVLPFNLASDSIVARSTFSRCNDRRAPGVVVERRIADADPGDEGDRTDEREPDVATHLTIIALPARRCASLGRTLTSAPWGVASLDRRSMGVASP